MIMNKKAVQSLIFASGLALGGLGTGLYMKNQDQTPELSFPGKDLTTFYDRVFDQDFFRREQSPFEQMEKMRKEMDKFFESTMLDFPKIAFDDWYGSKFGGSIGEIEQTEDEKYVYFTVDLEGVDKSTVKADVSGGHVTVSGSQGNIQAKEEEGTIQNSESYQTFRRSFPVPGGVDPNKVEIETKETELVIKFPKMPSLKP